MKKLLIIGAVLIAVFMCMPWLMKAFPLLKQIMHILVYGIIIMVVIMTLKIGKRGTEAVEKVVDNKLTEMTTPKQKETAENIEEKHKVSIFKE